MDHLIQTKATVQIEEPAALWEGSSWLECPVHKLAKRSWQQNKQCGISKTD